MVKPAGPQKMVEMLTRAGVKIDTHGKSGKADNCDRFRGRYPTDLVVSAIGYTHQAGRPIEYPAGWYVQYDRYGKSLSCRISDYPMR